MWNWREQIQLQIQAMKELQFLRVGIFDLHNYSACSHHYTTTVSYMHTSIDLWLCAWSLNERQLYEGQLHKKMVVSGSFYRFFGIRSATWLHTICAWDSSPHLPITPTQQMRLGIGQIVSWAVGNFNITSRPFFFKGDVICWLFVYCMFMCGIRAASSRATASWWSTAVFLAAYYNEVQAVVYQCKLYCTLCKNKQINQQVIHVETCGNVLLSFR